MWTQTSTATLKMTIFDEMRKFGADYVQANYSGGNDEGGLDDVELFKVAPPRARKDVVTITPKGGKPIRYVRIKPPAPGYVDYDHPLYEALDELLSYDFGSFAGDFRAYGTIFADTRQHRIWREGEVSTYSSDESGGEW